MRLIHLTSTVLALLALSPTTVLARKPPNGVLLTNVKTLTLRRDAQTSHRRVAAIPQLKCVGGSARGLYEIDVMRCKNQGSDYDDDNVQWTCTASLPEEFKLGATDVICEGYESPQDPYILKGSCGVEYRLMLTERGEERYGSERRGMFSGSKSDNGSGGWWFMILFFAIAAWIIYSMWIAYRTAPQVRRAPPRNNGGFWGGGWGGGGGGGGNDPYDPPPPYPGNPPRGKPSSSRAQEGWRPGFWSGAAGGAAAGYMAGSRGQRQQEAPPSRSGWLGGNNNGNSWGGGPGPSSNTRSGSNSGSSSRYEGTGFGSTTRR